MPNTLEITLNGFVDFLRTRGAGRVDVVTRQLTQYSEPYSPARDFYRRIITAIATGRRSGDDERILRAALESAPQYKRTHYEAVVKGWLEVLPEFEDTKVLPGRTGRWRDQAVTVRVTPNLLLEHADGRREALWLYVKADPLPEADAETMLWLADAAMNEVSPGAEPVVLDVRRAKVWRDVPESPGFGTWLAAEANGYAFLADKWEVAAA